MLNLSLSSNWFVREKQPPPQKPPAQQEPALASLRIDSIDYKEVQKSMLFSLCPYQGGNLNENFLRLYIDGLTAAMKKEGKKLKRSEVIS